MDDYTYQVTAFYDSPAHAKAAKDRVTASGVNASRITMIEGGSGAADETEAKGFYDKLSDFYMPEADRHAYAEGLRRGGALLSVGANADEYDRIADLMDEGTADLDERSQGWRGEGWTGQTAGAERDGTIEVAEEQLRVGKRMVDKGRVRLRAYTVSEEAVAEVPLRDETVEIERRPVDRAVGTDKDVFRDKTLEMEEHDEEAVVSKEARVTEEIDLKKTVDVENRQVRDTVRHTEVEVEDDRTDAKTRR